MKNFSGTRRFLLVAFGFPPRAGSGIHRVVRFAQLLPDNGWQPEVLTVSRWGNDIVDETWEKAIPANIRVYRAPSLDPFRIALALKSKLASSDARANGGAGFRSHSNGALSFLKSLYYKISIPDHSLWWIPAAVICGLFIILKNSPKLIFTTSGPYGAALAGLILKKFTGLPWAAEFRDPWSKHTMTQMSSLRRRIESAMEMACVRNADVVIATTPPTTAEFHLVTPESPEDKFITITNGFHIPDFESIPARSEKTRLTLAFTGMFYGSRSPEHLFSGLEEVCRRRPELSDRLRVLFAGTMSGNHRSKLEAEPLRSIVRIEEYVSHDRVLELLAEADALFLFLSKDEAEIFPAKLFEYLAARRFILATVPLEGITAEVIRRFEAGTALAPDDVKGIAEALTEMYINFKKGELKVKHSLEDIAEFSWPGLVKQLAEVFNRLTRGREG